MISFQEFINESARFYTADHKFFNPGTKWDEGHTTITKVETFGNGEWDATVYYTQADGSKSKKDIWNFQVKHTAPGAVKKKGPTPEEEDRMVKSMSPSQKEKYDAWKAKKS